MSRFIKQHVKDRALRSNESSLSALTNNEGSVRIDWNAPDVAHPNEDGVTVLPADWYCPEDEGLYDDLVSAEQFALLSSRKSHAASRLHNAREH